MIISSLSEERILEELIFDRKIMANEAKKLAKKAVLRQQKAGRDGIDNDIIIFREYTTSKNHNKWMLEIEVNMAKNPKWYHQAVCIVESERGTKDFYYVRGFSNNKPYFIKVSSHALKRFKERGVDERVKDPADIEAYYYAPKLFAKGEIITWMKITDPEFLAVILETDDSHKLTTLFFTMLGCFWGYETEKGNYDFRTLIKNNDIPKKRGENFAWSIAYVAHVVFNEKLYGRKRMKMVEDEGISIDKEKFPFKLFP